MQPTLDDQLQAMGTFLEVFLPEPDLAPVLAAELTQACTTDFQRDPWPTLYDLLQDHGYAWPMPWHTAPEDVAYGLRVLWESYGHPPLPFPDPDPAHATHAEEVVRYFSIAAQTQQMTLAHLYEDSDYAVLVLVRSAALVAAQRAAAAAEGTLSTFEPPSGPPAPLENLPARRTFSMWRWLGVGGFFSLQTLTLCLFTPNYC